MVGGVAVLLRVTAVNDKTDEERDELAVYHCHCGVCGTAAPCAVACHRVLLAPLRMRAWGRSSTPAWQLASPSLIDTAVGSMARGAKRLDLVSPAGFRLLGRASSNSAIS